MRGHTRRGAALFLAALTAALLAIGAGFLVWSLVGPADDGQAADQVLLGVFALFFGSVGAFLVARRPENAIGWLFVVDGLAGALAFACAAYAVAALYVPESSLPYGETIVWLATWLAIPGYAITAALVFLLFPDGRPISPRWRPIVWLGAFGIVLATAAFAVTPGPLEDPFQRFQNPHGMETLSDVLGFLGWPLVLAGLGAAIGIFKYHLYDIHLIIRRTLEGFGVRLRDEIDLDSLSGELRAVVQETMQPAHVSLWLRPGGRRG